MYKNHTIRHLKEDFDWQEYIEANYSVKYANGRNGQELRVCCPSCGEGDYKCYVNPEKAAFYCFKCPFRVGNGFDVFDFVSLTENITRGQALLRLLQQHKPLAPEDSSVPYGVGDNSEETAGAAGPAQKSFPTMREVSLPLSVYPLKAEPSSPYWKYLKNRGFTERDLAVTGAGYVPSSYAPIHDSHGNYKGNIGHRVVFPIYGPEGKLVSWQARAIKETDSRRSPKYLNSPESDLSKTLWPFSPPYEEEAVLVEGIIDALSVRQIAGVSAYATFTKRISRGQIEVLQKWGVKSVVLWYDKKDAHKDMIHTVETLKLAFKHVYVLDLSDWPENKDVGNFLNDSSGSAIIEDTLSKRISVYSLEYNRWKTTF